METADTPHDGHAMEAEKAEQPKSAALAEAKGMPMMTKRGKEFFKDYLKKLKHIMSEHKKWDLWKKGKLPKGIPPPEPEDHSNYDPHTRVKNPKTGIFEHPNVHPKR